MSRLWHTSGLHIQRCVADVDLRVASSTQVSFRPAPTRYVIYHPYIRPVLGQGVLATTSTATILNRSHWLYQPGQNQPNESIIISQCKSVTVSPVITCSLVFVFYDTPPERQIDEVTINYS